MAKSYRVTFLPQKISVEAEEGTSILEAEQKAGLEPDAPCGGAGKCGKCRVNIVEGRHTGVVLACQTGIDCDMKVDTGYQEKIRQILEGGFRRETALNPGVTPEGEAAFSIMAFDIGTTTVVGYLMDGRSGSLLAVVSTMNPQHQYGADVISRANYVLENDQGQEEMRDAIVGVLNRLISEACGETGIEEESVRLVTLVGNTCMHHLLLGISPDSLVHAPYVPKVKEGLILHPQDVGLTMAGDGEVMILPNIAGFVGADTVGCMLAVAFDKLDKLTLMIDIGTNGELVMGNHKKMVTTSTAAGPAFEGAKIECGMRGSKGAISSLEVVRGELKISVIEDGRPVGICGSGLIDILAFLIREGFIDNYGGFVDVEDLESDLARKESWRLTEYDGRPVFLLYRAEDTANGTPIYLSQKDVREVQLAKGAIAAGIQIMADKLGIRTGDIEQVYLAGAFGNYMNSASACEIGLIPYELRDRILPIGNAAGEGARLACLNREEYFYACRLADQADFIELATEPDFQDVFVDQLEFERAVER